MRQDNAIKHIPYSLLLLFGIVNHYSDSALSYSDTKMVKYYEKIHKLPFKKLLSHITVLAVVYYRGVSSPNPVYLQYLNTRRIILCSGKSFVMYRSLSPDFFTVLELICTSRHLKTYIILMLYKHNGVPRRKLPKPKLPKGTKIIVTKKYQIKLTQRYQIKLTQRY